MGHDFGNRYIEAIKEIGAAKVLEVARKYILPDAYVMVAVGAGGGEKVVAPEESIRETSVGQQEKNVSGSKAER